MVQPLGQWPHLAYLLPQPPARGNRFGRVEAALVVSIARSLILEPIREVLESDESDVIHCWALDSLDTGCQWKALPKDLPPKSTVHDYLELWNWDGTLERIHHAL